MIASPRSIAQTKSFRPSSVCEPGKLNSPRSIAKGAIEIESGALETLIVNLAMGTSTKRVLFLALCWRLSAGDYLLQQIFLDASCSTAPIASSAQYTSCFEGAYSLLLNCINSSYGELEIYNNNTCSGTVVSTLPTYATPACSPEDSAFGEFAMYQQLTCGKGTYVPPPHTDSYISIIQYGGREPNTTCSGSSIGEILYPTVNKCLSNGMNSTL